MSVSPNHDVWVALVDNPRTGPGAVTVWLQEALAWEQVAELLERYIIQPSFVLNSDYSRVKGLIENRKPQDAVVLWNSTRPKGAPIFQVLRRQVNRVAPDAFDMFVPVPPPKPVPQPAPPKKTAQPIAGKSGRKGGK